MTECSGISWLQLGLVANWHVLATSARHSGSTTSSSSRSELQIRSLQAKERKGCRENDILEAQKPKQAATKSPAACSKPTSGPTRRPRPLSASPRSVQLTAALGKKWIQAKLTFSRCTQQPAQDPQLAESKDTATETSLVGCDTIAAGLTASTVSEANTSTHEAARMRQDSPEADPGINLSIATWNVMGLTAVQEDVQQLFSRQRDGKSLDIIVLTETKLIPQQHGKIWLKPLFEGWSTHFSSKCPLERAAKHERKRSGSSGIIIACRNMGLGLDFEEDTNVPRCFAGQLTMINSSRLNMRIVGVYMPCNDPQKRTELYDFVASITKDTQ